MNGVINLYKEKGMTSFAAVAAVKSILGASKCGHLGTLDPMAEGALPVCVGFATRFAESLSSSNKEYVAQFRLGLSTDTYDITGAVLSENASVVSLEDEVKRVFENFKGETELKVPAFSAKKIDGVRAYKLARAGVLEDAGIRPMVIRSVALVSYAYPFGIIWVSCGKGTYIRSIIAEAGKILGCGAVMSGLIRTVNGVFKSKDGLTLEDLRSLAEKGEAEKALIPITELLDWGKAVVKDGALKGVLNGISPTRNGYLYLPADASGDDFFITDAGGRLLAVGARQENSPIPLKLKMVFN